MLLVSAAPAWSQTRVRLDFDTYAAGLRVAAVDTDFSMTQTGYGMAMSLHTVGLVGALFGGRQQSESTGMWDGDNVKPLQADGTGHWHGQDRRSVIDYARGQPMVSVLIPPSDPGREIVPEAMRAGTVDELSALMLLMHKIATDHTCNAQTTTFDGRRVVRLTSRTGAEEVLKPTDRSSFTGPALRCDFTGQILAGFMKDEEAREKAHPKHGSAWFATVLPGQPLLPVRMQFQTDWFGMATMYLTSAHDGPDAVVQAHADTQGNAK